MTKRTEISIEIDELVVVSAARTGVQCPPCPVCAGLVMVTLEQAVTATRRSSRELHCLIEAGQIHFAETAEGLVLICMNSLLKSN